jgi:hypothetical protein
LEIEFVGFWLGFNGDHRVQFLASISKRIAIYQPLVGNGSIAACQVI